MYGSIRKCHGTTCRTVLRMSTQLLSVWYSSLDTCQRADCLVTTGVELLLGRELSAGNRKGKGVVHLIIGVGLVWSLNVKITVGTTQSGMINGVLTLSLLTLYRYHRLEYQPILILIHVQYDISIYQSLVTLSYCSHFYFHSEKKKSDILYVVANYNVKSLVVVASNKLF